MFQLTGFYPEQITSTPINMHASYSSHVSDCPWTIDVQRYLPSAIRDNVTCEMTPNCLGITCCMDVEVDLPLMKQPLEYHIPFHLIFSPCDNMKIDLAFGSYTRVEQLLNYEFGKRSCRLFFCLFCFLFRDA